MRAAALGVTGTPTFFINGRRLVGAQPVEAFRDAVRARSRGGRQVVSAPPSLYVNAARRALGGAAPGRVLEDPLGGRGRHHKAILMRYEPGATIPRHRHLGDEQIWVLEGSVADDTGVCTAGNYARRPPGCVHSVKSETGALVLAVTSGPTEAV